MIKKIFFFSFRNYKTGLQVLKGSSMTTLLDFYILTPGKISSHKKLWSMKVKVHQKLPGFLPDYLL